MSSQYQAAAVPVRLRVSAVTRVHAGPTARVSGASGMPRPNTVVFAIRLTPAGGFRTVVKNGLPPCVTRWAA